MVIIKKCKFALLIAIGFVFLLAPPVSGAAPEVRIVTPSDDIIDNDVDWAGSGVDTNVTFTIEVQDVDGTADIDHVWFFIRAGDDATVMVDNDEITGYTDDNADTRTYTYSKYDAADNALPAAQLGKFDLMIVPVDDGGGFDNYDYGDASDAFIVDDLVSTPVQENIPHHYHRIYGTAAQGSGLTTEATNLSSAKLVDSNLGDITVTTSGLDYENDNFDPIHTSGGVIYALFRSENFDGQSDNLTYNYPNFPSHADNVNVDNTLIDRDNDGGYADIDTVITCYFTDNDGWDEMVDVWVGVRDKLNVIVENDNYTSSVVRYSENTLSVSFTYTATDNLVDNQLGTWDIWTYVKDNFITQENTCDSPLVVDDLYIAIKIEPDNAYLGFASGFPITVTGTFARVSGAAISIDNSWLIDENNGVTILGASDSVNETYDIGAAPSTDNIYVIFRGYDGTLDVENENYYDVNDNRVYSVHVYFEEDHTLVPDGTIENAIENRSYCLTFFYENATQEYNMTQNPENFVAHENVLKIRFNDNDNYWRMRIPASVGTLKFFAVDNLNELEQYEFLLKDLTGEYGIDDNGQLRFYKYYQDNEMRINDDYWDAEESCTVFLIYGEEYGIRVATGSRERAISHATADGILTKEIKVGTFSIDDALQVWEYVTWTAWWLADNTIRIAYQDNYLGTENVVVRIYDENDVIVYSTTFTTNEWALTWNDANENTPYVVKLSINHNTFGFSLVESEAILGIVWNPILPGTAIPGIEQLGRMPFAWGTAIAVLFVLGIGMTYRKHAAGFSVFTMGMMLVVLGPIVGAFTMNAGIMALIVILGVLLMFAKRSR